MRTPPPSTRSALVCLLCTLFLAMSSAACDGGDGGGDDPAVTTCATSFAFRPTVSASSVYVAGQWNGFDRSAHRLAGPDATGTYAAELQLPAGEWGYFFLIDGVVTLDPNAASTVEVAGQTCSRLEVVCDGVSAASVSLKVRAGSLQNERASAGAGHFGAVIDVESQGSLDALALSGTLRATDGSTRALTSSELALAADHGSATLDLTGLADGKYSVRVEAKNGRYGADLLLPFWIEAVPFSFYDSPIYMVMTDRFLNGEPANDSPISGSEAPANFQGGDLQGVTRAIEAGDFEALGVRTLWLSPWQTQPNRAHDDQISGNLTVHVTGYHGYWPIRAREVEPRFGGAEALHAMVRAAHARGMRVIMDTVLNPSS